MRSPLVIANWKMHKTIVEARAFLQELLSQLTPIPDHVGIAPPFTALRPLSEPARRGGVRLYAQNMHHARYGPFTGEIAAPMLIETGVAGVILGHAERRRLFGETDDAVRLKVAAALAAGLQPILCIGGVRDTRRNQQRLLRDEIQRGLADVPDALLDHVVLAYQPLGLTEPTTEPPDRDRELTAFARALVADRCPDAAARARILYGELITPDNARAILVDPNIDGLLVGRASLDPGALAAIITAATSSPSAARTPD